MQNKTDKDTGIVKFNTYLHNTSVEHLGRLCREYGTLQTYKKGEEFISAGEPARHMGLIIDGTAKYVVYTSGGDERVIGLETVGGFVASFPWCLRRLPSPCTVIINSEATICRLPTHTLLELMQLDEDVRQNVERATEAIFYTIYDRYIDGYAMSPKERYRQLLQNVPALFDIFQLKDIASYLNVTPYHLRRLRADI
ncbi:MAG: Crp/Fnr family transcriptional regulator [Bacteroidales bacterium]|nr:Crp/Fnr family transcriptional regulator [Bacteroidales bacterium]